MNALEAWQKWCEETLCDRCLALTEEGCGSEELCDKCRDKEEWERSRPVPAWLGEGTE